MRVHRMTRQCGVRAVGDSRLPYQDRRVQRSHGSLRETSSSTCRPPSRFVTGRASSVPLLLLAGHAEVA